MRFLGRLRFLGFYYMSMDKNTTKLFLEWMLKYDLTHTGVSIKIKAFDLEFE
jgi:hypothetical protein